MFYLFVGILAAFILWKILKSAFKLFFILIPLGLVCFFLFPTLFLFVGGLGFLMVGLLATLLIIGIAGLFNR